MEKKKLNLEISEIGPMAEKLNLAALPGPCGPCGQGLFDGPAPRGFWSNRDHQDSVVNIGAGAIAGSVGGWRGALAVGGSAGVMTCGKCHPFGGWSGRGPGRRSQQNSAGGER